MSGGRVVRVTVDGHSYEVPEIWIVGYCRAGRSIADAIRQWHDQAQMQVAFNQQNEGAQ